MTIGELCQALDGADSNMEIKIGCFFDEELVTIATISKTKACWVLYEAE